MVCSFLLLYGILFNKYNSMYISIFLLMDSWNVFRFCLLGEKLLQMFLSVSFREHMLSFLLFLYQWVELLVHRADVSFPLVKLLTYLHGTKILKAQRSIERKVFLPPLHLLFHTSPFQRQPTLPVSCVLLWKHTLHLEAYVWIISCFTPKQPHNTNSFVNRCELITSR